MLEAIPRVVLDIAPSQLDSFTRKPIDCDWIAIWISFLLI